ncbi:MAG: hypothetical protein KJO83_00950 [Bacteroidia bacterium]|nr:hypothetical protein [Bacteroidia bacterium]
MLLEKIINDLEQKIDHADKLAANISEKAVDWHIDHSLKVIIAVVNALQNSDPADYKWKFNFIRFYIFTVGSIPRGKGKAPKSVLPADHIIKENLLLQLKEAKERLKIIEKLPLNSNFKHPYFGILNVKMTTTFLDIHTKHHLKIINDIVSK